MMPNGLMTVALGLAMQVGQPSPSETPNYPPLQNAFSQHGFEGQFEQRYPFDTQQNWVHGYFQEIPAYGGHAFYRPYNYKDVLSQSQTAAGWGQSPTMPYSQQFWHRYHDQAVMLKLSQNASATMSAPQLVESSGNFAPAPQGMIVMQPGIMAPPAPAGAVPAGVWVQPGPQYPMAHSPVVQAPAIQYAQPQYPTPQYAPPRYPTAPSPGMPVMSQPVMAQPVITQQYPSAPAGWQALPNGTIVPAGNFTPAPQGSAPSYVPTSGPVLLPGGFVAPSTNP